jgi:hypothetical protein
MTANELADELESCRDYELPKFVHKTATMLRKQADRIGVLEANHKIQLDINEKALQYIEQLEQGLQASLNLNKAQNERK